MEMLINSLLLLLLLVLLLLLLLSGFSESVRNSTQDRPAMGSTLLMFSITFISNAN